MQVILLYGCYIFTIIFEWEITINIHVAYNNQVILRVTSRYINVIL